MDARRQWARESDSQHHVFWRAGCCLRLRVRHYDYRQAWPSEVLAIPVNFMGYRNARPSFLIGYLRPPALLKDLVRLGRRRALCCNTTLFVRDRHVETSRPDRRCIHGVSVVLVVSGLVISLNTI